MSVTPEQSHPAERPPLCQENILNVIYYVLFHPVYAFRCMQREGDPEGRLLLFAFITVAYVAFLSPLMMVVRSGEGSWTQLLIQVPFQIVVGTLVWAFLAAVVGLLAYAFRGESQFRTFLTMSGFAVMPWIFMAPIAVLQVNAVSAVEMFCSFAGTVVWLWSVILFAVAIKETYGISAERAMIILVTPVMLLLFLFVWSSGFIAYNMLRLLF